MPDNKAQDALQALNKATICVTSIHDSNFRSGGTDNQQDHSAHVSVSMAMGLASHPHSLLWGHGKL